MPTQKAIAEHLDLDQGAVSRHLAELGLDWKTNSMDTIRLAYIRNLRSAAAGHTSGEFDLTRERAMTEKVDREIKLYTLAEKRGQLVSLAQLEPELAQMIVAFRTELLSRDDKLKSEIDALYGISVDPQLLEAHTRAALTQLARYDPERAEHGAPVGSVAGATGEAEHHPVVAPAASAL